MRPKVLILARENVLHWAPLYRAAFEACCDVVTVGPALNRAGIAAHGWEHTAQWLKPNDHVSDSDDVLEILRLLPAGWVPDLVVGVQSGAPVYRNLPMLRCPKVYLSIDSWHDHTEFKTARAYDHVNVAQRVFAPYFGETGSRASWLPLACSPAHHHPVDVTKDYDITFGGALHWKVSRERRARLERLQEHFLVYAAGGVGGEELCRHCCRGRVAFNSSIHQDVNMRVFETLAMGMPLLTNRSAVTNGLLDLFDEGEHFVSYDDDDLVEKAQALLGDGALRARIARAGRDRVLEAHTYRHRVDTILREMLQDERKKPAALVRDDARLSTWLPYFPGDVLDVGLRLDRSKVALRRHGVKRLAGAHTMIDHPRARSYDNVLAFPLVSRDEQFDTILWASPETMTSDLEQGVAGLAACLRSGGTMVLKIGLALAEQTPVGVSWKEWRNWMNQHRLHLEHLQQFPEENALIVVARKYARSLAEVSEEIYARFPAPMAEF